MRLSLRTFGPIALLGAASSLAAQDAPRATPCDGRTVSHVEFRRASRTIMDKQHAPGWARAVLQPLLLGAPTRAEAINPYLQLHDGGACTERRRAESERLLRALPYIADATVKVFDEADGRVRVEVETIDDIRPIIGAGVRDSKPSNLEIGSNNIGGAGYLAAVRWRDGRAFRDGLGVRMADYRLLNGPNVAQLSLERTPLGSFSLFSVGRPFFSDLQHAAGYVGYFKDDGYMSFVRPVGDPLSLRASRERTDAGLSLRVTPIGATTFLLGALVSAEHRNVGSDVVIIRDTGLVDTTSTLLQGRYSTQRSTRAAFVVGVRSLQFAKARAFDGLESAQDIARGLQLSTSIGRGVSGIDRRAFVTADLYAGVGNAESFVGLRTLAEVRNNAGGWGDGVVSGRLAWYRHASARQTGLLSVEYVGSSSDSVPYQLSMADVQSGLRGYTGSRLVGGRRVIARAERRIIMPGISRYLGWGIAGFADAGQMWAGKVPFGADGFRASAGVSLLTAVPRESRSVLRVDVGYPLAKDANAKGVDVRVTYKIFGRAFWKEPTQLSRARLGSPTTDIFAWP